MQLSTLFGFFLGWLSYKFGKNFCHFYFFLNFFKIFFCQKKPYFANTRRDAHPLKKNLKKFLKKLNFFWKNCWQTFSYYVRIRVLTQRGDNSPNRLMTQPRRQSSLTTTYFRRLKVKYYYEFKLFKIIKFLCNTIFAYSNFKSSIREKIVCKKTIREKC